MKILKVGVVPIYELHCGVCGTDFEASFDERSDIVEVTSIAIHPTPRMFDVMFTCPVCKATIIITEDIIKN